MKPRLLAFAGVAFAAALAAAAAATAPAPPILKLPARPDQSVTPESLVGREERDVRLEDTQGNVTIYHGRSLLEVLEKGGLDVKTMAGEREAAAAVVVATGRDGYAVVFSVGELTSNRSNPKVYLVADKDGEPLPENEGPVRLIVYGDKVRSAYGLATIELRYLAKNKR